MPVMSRLMRRFRSAPPEPETPAEPVTLDVDQVTDLLLRQARHENPGDPDVRKAVRDAVEEIEHNAMSRLADDEEKDAWWLLQRGRTARAINVLHRNLRTGLPEFMRAAAATRLGALTMLNDRATAIHYFEQAWIIDHGSLDAWLHWVRLLMLEGRAEYPLLLARDLARSNHRGAGDWLTQPTDDGYLINLDRLRDKPIGEQARIPRVLAMICEMLAPAAAGGELHPGDIADYSGILQTGRAMAREVGDESSEFRLLAAQAFFELEAGEGIGIDALIDQAIEVGRTLPASADRVRVLELLAISYSRAGNSGQAIDTLNDAAAICRQDDNQFGEARVLRQLAEIHQGEERWQDAGVLLQRALTLFSRIGISAEVGRTLVLLGDLADELGDRPGAVQRWQDALVPLVRGGWPKLATTLVDWLEETGQEIRVGNELPWIVDSHWHVLDAHDVKDRPDLAREHLAAARSLARRRENLQSLRKALQAVINQYGNAGYIRFFARSLEQLALWQAASHVYEMIEASADNRDDPAVGHASLQAARMAWRGGNSQRVRQMISEAADVAVGSGDLALTASVSDFSGRLNYLNGDTDRELSELNLAIRARAAAGQEALSADLYFRKGLNELRRATVDGLQAAGRSFGRAAELFTADADLVPRAEAHLYLGDVMMRLDEPEDAFQAWAEALDCYRRSRLPAEALLAEERLIQAGMV